MCPRPLQPALAAGQVVLQPTHAQGLLASERRPISMRIGVHEGTIARPAATVGARGTKLPGIRASTATTTTMPRRARLCTTLLDPPFLISLSKLDSKLQLLGRRIIRAIADLGKSCRHSVAFHVSDLRKT